MVNSMVLLGITGGIGSGKSYVASIMRSELGIPVYDCDTEAKRLTATDPDIRRRLTELVGEDIYRDGQLVRQRLADCLFRSKENARQVNAIIHPAVLRDFRQWAEHQEQAVVAMESAILYESGFHAQVDKVIFVDAPEEIRLRRAMLRDNATEAQVRARMQMQQTETNKARADYIVDNASADDTRLQEQLREIIVQLKTYKNNA